MANSFLMPSVIAMNFGFYRLLRHHYPGETIKFAQLSRTLILACAYSFVSTYLYAIPKCRDRYLIDINSLFDQNEPYLYENQHFRALLRRVCNRQGQLVNQNFEINPELLALKPDFDSWYSDLDHKAPNEKQIGWLASRLAKR